MKKIILLLIVFVLILIPTLALADMGEPSSVIYKGHISNKYAKFITSRPHSYSEDGLENIVQLLTMKANKIKLNEEILLKFKTGIPVYKKLNLEKYINNFRNQSNQLINPDNKYNIEYYVDNFQFNLKDKYRLDYFLSKRI